MKATQQLKGTMAGVASILAALIFVLAAGKVFQPAAEASSVAAKGLAIPLEGTRERQGYSLFMLNCAHCHGSDARGDEGPDLHEVTKSDARIASIIKDGVKGEMPKFGTKLSDDDVRGLVAFVRSLKEQ
ncbi:MAG: lipoprotein cytochrome c, 1 heme-binding site [Pedosphaera sp.]|nr:lipoprotein cytochrome c, 1 heme-binding site [Pedosphaera sp.]